MLEKYNYEKINAFVFQILNTKQKPHHAMCQYKASINFIQKSCDKVNRIINFQLITLKLQRLND